MNAARRVRGIGLDGSVSLGGGDTVLGLRWLSVFVKLIVRVESRVDKIV